MKSKRCFVSKCCNDENNHVTFHRLPKDETEQKKWLAFLEKVNEDKDALTYSTLSVTICSDHFLPEDRAKLSSKKRKGTVPCLLHGTEVHVPDSQNLPIISSNQIIPFTLNPCDLWQCVIDLSTKLSCMETKLEALQMSCEMKDTDIRNCRKHIKTLQKQEQRQSKTIKRRHSTTEEADKRPRLQDACVETNLEDLMEMPRANKLLSELNNRMINAKKNHSEFLKKFSFGLHFHSASGYDYLRNSLENILPHCRNFPRWTESVKAKPGILTNSVEFLKQEQLSSQYRIFHALTFDEVYIKQQIIHTKDTMIGLVNYGGLAPEPMEDKIAKTALFFMINQINGSKKVPVAYILTDGLKPDLLHLVVQNVIRYLNEANLKIITITYDGLPTNRSAMEKFGCNLNPLSALFRPSFLNSFDGCQTFNILDPSHMFKLIRNLWKKMGIIYNNKGEVIDWKYIEKLNSLQEQCGLKLANKLSSRHVSFENNKMKTKLCTQTLSNSISVAIGVCRKLKQTGFEGSEPTERFVAIMNRLFDTLNSRVNGKGIKSPLNRFNYSVNKKWLQFCKTYLLGLKTISTGKPVPIISTTSGTAIKGLIITICSLLEIMDSILMNPAEDLQYLPVYKCSQDHIELYFGLLRGRHGRNNNPNVLQLQCAVRDLLCMKIKDLATGNCSPLEDLSVLVSPFQTLKVISESEATDEEEEFPVLNYTADSIVSNIVAYIAGFVVRKLCKCLTCSSCICLLCPTERQSYFVIEDDFLLLCSKNNGGLMIPNKSVVKICKAAESSVRFWQQKGLNQLDRNKVISTALRECTKLGLVADMSCLNDCSLADVKDGTLSHHGLDLVKRICEEFIKIRLHHIAKSTTLQMNPGSNRSVCTKSVHFKGN